MCQEPLKIADEGGTVGWKGKMLLPLVVVGYVMQWYVDSHGDAVLTVLA